VAFRNEARENSLSDCTLFFQNVVSLDFLVKQSGTVNQLHLDLTHGLFIPIMTTIIPYDNNKHPG